MANRRGSNGHSLVELKAILRMLQVMLDIAEEQHEDVIHVDDVKDLQTKYQKEVDALERLSW